MTPVVTSTRFLIDFLLVNLSRVTTIVRETLNDSVRLRAVRDAVGIVDIAVRKLELDRRVNDAIVMLQHVIDAIEKTACALQRDVPDHQMTGKRGAGGAEGPDVDVVDAVDAIDRCERSRHGDRIDFAGRAFEQEIQRFAENAPAAPQNQNAEDRKST